MNAFRFAQITWIHAIWLVLLLTIVLIVLEFRGRSLLDRFISQLMQVRLVQRPSGLRKCLAIGFLAAALLALVLAMMRPQWGQTVQRLSRVDSQIMICLDVSKSMLAEDVAPSRLTRAQVELESLLGLMDESQQVGLIAFSGKATVLCPMTTDFGFLRLVLNEARPESVGLGGTRIGDAIRKAVDGFRTSGDVNRMILLITDGEDHDSFPLDAAKVAREKGIRIVSIGIGDERGSKIPITDPRTGARTFVTDQSGNEVVSRLDGAALREVALQTEGAYIPAGTGALDLESIYQAHIATLLKGTATDSHRVVRSEAYQWFVLAALLLLMLSTLSAAPLGRRAFAGESSRRHDASRWSKTAAAVLVTVCVWPQQGMAVGRQTTASPDKLVPPSAGSDVQRNQPSRIGSDPVAPVVIPREAYNQSLSLIKENPDRAEELLNIARRDAGVDGELRYRSLYNLGWVEVQRADNLLQERPEDALVHLQQAANRFREAIRVRPEAIEARQNLEIVSRRILELSDALANEDASNLETRLDELIGQEREHQLHLQQIVQRYAGSIEKSAVNEEDRQVFRGLAVTQRQIISDLQRITDDAHVELDALTRTDEESSPEDKMRGVQLGNMLTFADQSLQRLNKARSLTRRGQVDRSFLRWSAGLAQSKRARDQLRNPVEVLGVIIGDAIEMAGLTRDLALARSALPAASTATPAWLTEELLQETQLDTTERTAELRTVLQSVVGSEGANRPDAIAPVDADSDAMLENIRQALPLLERAGQDFGNAQRALQNAQCQPAFEQQLTAIAALQEAWELFFDIKRLIEQIYAQQTAANRLLELGAPEEPSPSTSVDLPSLAAGSASILEKNLERCSRLEAMLQRELDALQTASSANQDASAANASPEQLEAERQSFETAIFLLERAVGHAQTAAKLVEEFTETSGLPGEQGGETRQQDSDPDTSDSTSEQSQDLAKPPDHPFSGPQRELAESLVYLEELRRLFFSLVEHLRDTAQRQSDLNDRTLDLAATQDQRTPESLGPLEHRQRQLETLAEQIGQALQQQAEQAASGANSPQAGTSPQVSAEDAAQAAQTLGQAAEAVHAATDFMTQAAEQLRATSTDTANSEPLELATHRQASALEELLEALSLLDQENQDQDNQGDQNQQDQNQQNEQTSSDEQQRDNMSFSQLLQLIRDREAQRREDKQRRVSSSGGAVDKDW